MKTLAYLPLLIAAALAAGCAPLTFSEAGAMDFKRYAAVYVDVDAPAFGDGASEYLAGELRNTSGFERVTTGAEPVDLILTVQVSVSEDTLSNNDDLRYEARATYRATTPGGSLIDEGSEHDTSATPSEAVEDALDEVSLHYIRPYRL